MVKTSAAARQVLDLFQHVHGDKGFEVPGINDPVNEPTVAPITGYNNPAPNGYQKAPKFQSKVGQLGSNPLLLPQRLLGLQARTSWQTMLLAEHPKPALTSHPGAITAWNEVRKTPMPSPSTASSIKQCSDKFVARVLL
ncbi:uncharacterized protein FPRN_07783 [Fusarium proliferatum]|nr:uncharacterized protein FPRN_07783 [Fusarium proliferatum]